MTTIHSISWDTQIQGNEINVKAYGLYMALKGSTMDQSQFDNYSPIQSYFFPVDKLTFAYDISS